MASCRVTQSRPEAKTEVEEQPCIPSICEVEVGGLGVQTSFSYTEFQASLRYMTPKQKKTEAKADKGKG